MSDLMRRTPVVRTLEEAIEVVGDNAVIGIGGAVTAGHPMAFVRALASRGVRDLSVVAPTAGLEVDLLVAARCVSTVATAYVGAESASPLGPAFRAAVEAGSIEVWDGDEAHLILGLRAAGQGLPFLPWRGGVGTSIPDVNPALVEFDDPVCGQRLLAVPALELDVALLHADVADEYGNVQFGGTGYMDPLIASAAECVLVQVNRIVSNDQIRRHPERTHFWRNVTIVQAPFGTHPYASGTMAADEEHLAQYVQAARAAAAGKPALLDAYLTRYVREPKSHLDYLEAVGIRRIAELMV